MTMAIVAYDYAASNPDELSIREGESVKVLGTDDGGWINVELRGKTGTSNIFLL